MNPARRKLPEIFNKSCRKFSSSPIRKYFTQDFITRNPDRSKWMEEAILYVHWPYCEKKCTYCNFNKYVVASMDQERMKKCLSRETETLIKQSGVKRIKSVFFGGGTPSLAEPFVIENILETIKKTANLLPEAEITLEANPTSTGAAKLRDFKDAGIDRISLGVQSVIDSDLTTLGRDHTAAEALKCIELCKSIFPGRMSLDVIFGRPGQNLKDWSTELEQILAICDDHLSAYQLTLEQGTPLFKQVMNRQLALPHNDEIADMYELLVKKSAERGFIRYEASNFAKHEGAECVHNRGYWESTQYIGVGPGAHGRFVSVGETQRSARVQTFVPDTWMTQVEQKGHGTLQAVHQSQNDVLREALMLSLRTKAGITHQQWKLLTDINLEEIFGETLIMKTLQTEGYLIFDETGVRATETGINVADGIIAELVQILEIMR